MFSRLWQSLSSWFTVNNEQPAPLQIVNRKQPKQRFLIIDDPYEHKKIANKQVKIKMQQQIPKNAEQVVNLYRLTENFQQDKQRLKEANEYQDFVFDLSQLNRVIKQIQQKSNKILNQKHQDLEDASQLIAKIKKGSSLQHRERQIYRRYVSYVLNVLETKYSGEKIDYPKIQYQYFRKIYQIWDVPQKQGQDLVPGYEFLRFCHVKLLGPGRWLNDQVISEQIGFMNGKLSEKHANPYIILNSLKVTSLFDKSDYKRLQKLLQRQKVNRNSILLLAIHKTNHWLFLKMQNSSIEIYDSMLSNNTQYYLNFPLIGKIIKFAEYYYQEKPRIERVLDFPQQRNGSDCGVMMLCGMKDLVRECREWTFSQNDMWYKRALITKELLEKKISGFENF